MLGNLLKHSLVEIARIVKLSAALLEFDVREPRLLVGEALHPALKHRTRRDDVSRHLLEIGVFVPTNEEILSHRPELVHTRQNRNGTVIHVSRAVDVLVSDLEFGVFQPERGGRLIHVQRSLEYVTRSLELSLTVKRRT